LSHAIRIRVKMRGEGERTELGGGGGREHRSYCKRRSEGTCRRPRLAWGRVRGRFLTLGENRSEGTSEDEGANWVWKKRVQRDERKIRPGRLGEGHGVQEGGIGRMELQGGWGREHCPTSGGGWGQDKGESGRQGIEKKGGFTLGNRCTRETNVEGVWV